MTARESVRATGHGAPGATAAADQWYSRVMKTTHFVPLVVGVLWLTACGAPTPPAAGPGEEVGALEARDAFLDAIRQHCGGAYAGRIVANEPAEPDDPFVGKTLVMHVRGCAEGEIRIPFHVGDDRSRTWVVTRTAEGLRLKHDHRHEDGSDDATSWYGGDTVNDGSARRQEFPVDAFSIEMFEREGWQASTSNVWAVEIEPGRRFLYELSRPGGRLFQVEFDLAVPVEVPPAPWGSEGEAG